MKRIALLLLFCAAGAWAHHPKSHHHGSPPPAPAGFASLDLYTDGGTIHLLAGELKGERMQTVYRRSADGVKWSSPVRVDRDGTAPSGVRPSNDAQIAARGSDLVAVWSVAGTGWGGSGPLASALSSDGGASWRPGPNPSDTGLTTGHGFADLLFDGAGLHAVWLDGRDKKQGLRYARSADAGSSWQASATIAPATCECCWNSLASRGGEISILYRGKEPRDMQLAVGTGARWQRKGAVGAFGWNVKGCPETGGALVADKNALHALVWTGSDKNLGVHFLSLADKAAKWSAPRRIGGSEARYADLAASGTTLAVAWDEGDAVYLARSSDAGRNWGKAERLSAAGAAASHPRIVALAQGFVVVWGEQEKGRVREMRHAVRN